MTIAGFAPEDASCDRWSMRQQGSFRGATEPADLAGHRGKGRMSRRQA